MKTLKLISGFFTKYFTFWIIGFFILAYIYTESFAKLAYLITPALGLIMFGMGITLTGADVKRVILRPQELTVEKKR